MKKLFITAIMSLSLLTTSTFAEVKVGIILGFTGPIESLTPAMRDSAKLAFQEASDSGSLLGGETITVLEGDSTCVDSAAAQLPLKDWLHKVLLQLWERIVLELLEQLQVM